MARNFFPLFNRSAFWRAGLGLVFGEMYKQFFLLIRFIAPFNFLY